MRLLCILNRAAFSRCAYFVAHESRYTRDPNGGVRVSDVGARAHNNKIPNDTTLLVKNKSSVRLGFWTS